MIETAAAGIEVCKAGKLRRGDSRGYVGAL